MSLPCLCVGGCGHQMAWHRAFEKCGDVATVRCEVEGCICEIRTGCDHVAGLDGKAEPINDATVLRALGILAL